MTVPIRLSTLQMLLSLVLAVARVTLVDTRAVPDLPQATLMESPTPELPSCVGCRERPSRAGRAHDHFVSELAHTEAQKPLLLQDYQAYPCLISGRTWALVVTTVVLGSILMILKSRQLSVRILAILYIISLSAITLTMRSLTLPPLSYRYPSWVALIHYFFTWAVTVIYWCGKCEPSKLLPSSTGSLRQYCTNMGPIAFALPLSIIMSNKALIYMGAGLVAIITNISPLITAVLSWFCGRQIVSLSWIGVAVSFSGAAYISLMEGEMIHRAHSSTHTIVLGVLFTVLSMLFRSARTVIQDMLMSPAAYAGVADAGKAQVSREPQVAISSMHLVAAQSPPVLLVATAFSVITEGVIAPWVHLTRQVVQMLILTSALAVMVNILGVTILKDLGSTSVQMIGCLQSVVTTAISLAFFGEYLPTVVLLGSTAIICGIAVFEMGEAQRGSKPKLTPPSPLLRPSGAEKQPVNTTR